MKKKIIIIGLISIIFIIIASIWINNTPEGKRQWESEHPIRFNFPGQQIDKSLIIKKIIGIIFLIAVIFAISLICIKKQKNKPLQKQTPEALKVMLMVPIEFKDKMEEKIPLLQEFMADSIIFYQDTIDFQGIPIEIASCLPKFPAIITGNTEIEINYKIGRQSYKLSNLNITSNPQSKQQ